MNDTNNPKTLLMYGGILLTVCASVYALTGAYEKTISARHPASQGATITVTGEGEATAVPDVATISFTVREVAKTVPEAQKLAEAKIKAATDALKARSISDKDIKTTSYTVNPRYETEDKLYCTTIGCPSPKQVITGYEVAQSIQVKVRKIDTVGAVIGDIGAANISELYGPDFTVDDMDVITKEAKDKAIKDAREKGLATADSLGVSLGRIVGYNENNYGGAPVPMYARATSAYDKAEGVSPTLPQGEMLTKMYVSITYELK